MVSNWGKSNIFYKKYHWGRGKGEKKNEGSGKNSETRMAPVLEQPSFLFLEFYCLFSFFVWLDFLSFLKRDLGSHTIDGYMVKSAQGSFGFPPPPPPCMFIVHGMLLYGSRRENSWYTFHDLEPVRVDRLPTDASLCYGACKILLACAQPDT